MSDSSILISNYSYNWNLSKPILRYVLGTCFVLCITTLLDYELSYLTSVLSLSFLAPGAKPLALKKAIGFVVSLVILTGTAFLFSQSFIDYPLVFMPLLCLTILWLYYTDKFPMVIKLFAIISVLLIPLMTMEASALGAFISLSLVFNTLMAVILTQLMFIVIPWSKEDDVFSKDDVASSSIPEIERFKYALNILCIMLPLLFLFYIFKLSGGLLVLMFVAILSISPALSNPKVGGVMIVANIFGGLFAILAFKLLVVVPLFVFMILLVLIVGLIFANNLFSKKKIAAIFGTGFSTFLLILGSVTTSDATAGEEVWTRVIMISGAVIYVVIAFAILNYIQKLKTIKSAV